MPVRRWLATKVKKLVYKMHTYCFFSAQFLPTVGGVERYTYNLAKKMLERGDQVFVVTSFLPGQPEEEYFEGIKVYRVPSWLFAKGRLPLAKRNKTYKRIMAGLAEAKIDRIIIQTRLYHLSFLGLLFAKEQKIQAIILEHGSDHLFHSNPFVRAGLKAYEHILVSKIGKLNPSFYAVSKKSGDWLTHFNIVAKDTLHNSIDIAAVERIDKKTESRWRERYGVPRDHQCVAYTGRLIPEKGSQQLADAVLHYNASKKKDAPALTLFIAGEGSLGKTNFPEDNNIILLGGLPHKDILSLLKEMEIFCLPTNYPEGFPTSVLEAAACGCFLIATDRGGSRELICDDRYGILIPDNTPKTLVTALARAAGDSQYRESAARKAQKQVSECFTTDALYDKISNIW